MFFFLDVYLDEPEVIKYSNYNAVVPSMFQSKALVSSKQHSHGWLPCQILGPDSPQPNVMLGPLCPAGPQEQGWALSIVAVYATA